MKPISVIIVLLCLMFTASAQMLSVDELQKEGARIGRNFQRATKMGDVEGQKNALNDLDAILSTLKKQEQVDALTEAFNNCNIEISTPEKDAKAYVVALGNAIVDGDSIAIEDANDIIQTVKERYQQQNNDSIFSYYLTMAKCALDCGLNARFSQNEDELLASKSQIEALKGEYMTDNVAQSLIDYIYGFFATTISDVDTDAKKCASMIINAQKSGSEEQLNNANKTVGYYYARYVIEKGEIVAQEFNDKIQLIINQ